MKVFALFAMLALPLTGAAHATVSASSDGALAVKSADGKVVFNGRGGVIGRIDLGQVTIKDPNPYDGTGPIVTGADTTLPLGERTTRYSGKNLRFRIIGGTFSITVVGSGINLSVIGRGLTTLDGNDDGTDGTYAVNGDTTQPFPLFRFTFPLDASSSSTG